MLSKRSYDDGCAAAHALDLIGERWALLVVRELMLSPKRFNDLRADLPQISPNVLSQRLKDLETYGIVRKTTLPPPVKAQVYELTPWGKDLEPVLVHLGRWAVHSPFKPDAQLSLTSLILSFRTMFKADEAEGLEATYSFKLDDYSFVAHVHHQSFEITLGDTSQADAYFEGNHDALAGLVYGDANLEEMIEADTVKLIGDKHAFKRFLTLFPLPDEAAQNDVSP
ncbi:MAG: winged helix-turn-helix transcriptional regulator [Deinococcota bacterium]